MPALPFVGGRGDANLPGAGRPDPSSRGATTAFRGAYSPSGRAGLEILAGLAVGRALIRHTQIPAMRIPAVQDLCRPGTLSPWR
ncbi:hypothetical protein BL253_16480 [Pseudofrankia asymbiotica]|uniref:Uncharacterized protein n=1 Tax=Pseudofrankia asymbiotica TaxID=1834516 RepID=A0A1V2IBU6_9ACTN|nr:hypothetical protein BL253_16480 [Pseudofrankia asymbiotica]